MSRRNGAMRHFKENRAFMDRRVNAGIEQHRKGACRIEVVDGDGSPVGGARVIARQKSHEFKFGANVFMLDEFENDEKNVQYRQAFANLFNLATIPFYWSDLEPVQGKPRYGKDSLKIYRRPAPDLCLEYCREKGIEPKCHCLNYDNFIPEWLYDADVEYHKTMLEQRFCELSGRYAGEIPSWEVTNETFNSYGSRYQTKFYQEDDFVEWSFRMADRYFPNNRLIINDYVVWGSSYRENRSPYYMQIERLFRNGISHLDSIGFQFHSFFPQEEEEKHAQERYNPIHLTEVMDKYASFGKKLQITEMTIPAYSNRAEDEEIQAELLKNIYSLFFSHPAMEAIIYWNLVDGYAAFAPQGDMTSGENVYHGGLMRFDMSKKPAYDTLKNLIEIQWHTEAETGTDDGGRADFRGFYGDYDVIVSDGSRQIQTELKLSSRKNNVNKIVLE